MTDLKDEHVKQKLPKDARLAAKCLQETGSFETGQAIFRECADRIEELEAKLAQAQTWQPIETAPKDGTKFLAYWPDHLGNGSDCVVTTWFGPWATGSELVFQTAFEWAHERNPTHWMPHAAPPAPPSQN
jgi:hypothetical protein